MAVQTLDQATVKQLVILRGGVVVVVKQIEPGRINLRIVFKEEYLSLPPVTQKPCLLKGFVVICPALFVDKYCQTIAAISRKIDFFEFMQFSLLSYPAELPAEVIRSFLSL